ncbi:outer membrane lipoprotein-sorting protein [Treponema sp.]|uniref:outer membrane lipoprotein-sorting protein n=1 Tax=Treponema sp. TaxID=166 RepID=UPI0025F980CC|nr:outer membrane lipoprotein-sorting protein [Treponema sp.]MCR5218416.1 outer membrane lipoprotein-sorting protein [Treponema sp.]
MKLTRISRFITCASLILAASVSTAEELTGYEIAKRADEVNEGTTSSYTATMTLTNKKGAVRTREITMKAKDYGDVKKAVIVFTMPKDVTGVSYLSFEYPDSEGQEKKDSDSWLYMPAMKKVRRISGSGKDDDFMGTDFTYADMGDRGLTKDTFTLLGEENAEGFDCYKVEAVAKDKSEKTQKRIIWYRKDNYLPVKGEFYDKQNQLAREMTCSDIKQIDGIWTTGKMFMKNIKTGHSTLLEMKNVQYNISLDDKMFTVASIERGNIR